MPNFRNDPQPPIPYTNPLFDGNGDPVSPQLIFPDVLAELGGNGSGDGNVTTGAQTFQGAKTFADPITFSDRVVFKGDVTEVESVNMTVADNIIVVNTNESGAGVTTGFAGIEVERGTENNARLVWDEAEDKFYGGVVGALSALLDESAADARYTTETASDLRYVSLTDTQSIGGAKTFAGSLTISGTTNVNGNLTSNTQTFINSLRPIRVPNPAAGTDVMPRDYADARYAQLDGTTFIGDVIIDKAVGQASFVINSGDNLPAIFLRENNVEKGAIFTNDNFMRLRRDNGNDDTLIDLYNEFIFTNKPIRGVDPDNGYGLVPRDYADLRYAQLNGTQTIDGNTTFDGVVNVLSGGGTATLRVETGSLSASTFFEFRAEVGGTMKRTGLLYRTAVGSADPGVDIGALRMRYTNAVTDANGAELILNENTAQISKPLQVPTPLADTDAMPRSYADARYAQLDGATFTGPVIVASSTDLLGDVVVGDGTDATNQNPILRIDSGPSGNPKIEFYREGGASGHIFGLSDRIRIVSSSGAQLDMLTGFSLFNGQVRGSDGTTPTAFVTRSQLDALEARVATLEAA